MSEKSRSALILKLSKQNLEVHNVDQSIWTIQNALSDESEVQNLGINPLNNPYFLTFKFNILN